MISVGVKPTNHKVFGQASWAGDALLTTAFAVLAEASLPAERVQQGHCRWPMPANGMVGGGQVLDFWGGNSCKKGNPRH